MDASASSVGLVFTTHAVCQLFFFYTGLFVPYIKNCSASDWPIGITSVKVTTNLSKEVAYYIGLGHARV